MQGPMQTLDAAPGVQVVAILISRHQSRHCLQARRAITLPEWTFRQPQSKPQNPMLHLCKSRPSEGSQHTPRVVFVSHLT